MKVNKQKMETIKYLVKVLNRTMPSEKLRIEGSRLYGPQRLIDFIITQASPETIEETTNGFNAQVVSYPQDSKHTKYKVTKSSDGSFFLHRLISVGGVKNLQVDEAILPLTDKDIKQIKNISNVTPEDIAAVLEHMKTEGRMLGL